MPTDCHSLNLHRIAVSGNTVYGINMSTLPESDQHYFLAAEGWLELGNIQECYNELEEISPMYKTHRSVLELRVKMYAKAEKWDHVEAISETLA